MNWGVRAGLGRKNEAGWGQIFVPVKRLIGPTWVVATVAVSRRTSCNLSKPFSGLCGQGVVAVELLLMNPELSSAVIDLAVASLSVLTGRSKQP